MRGTKTMRQVGGAIVVAAALVGATGPATASAAVYPACSARLVEAPANTQASCRFDNPYDRAVISVVVDGTVTVALRCNAQFGYTYTTQRTFAESDTWNAYTPGGCEMVLTAISPGTTAVATATPTIGRIIEPYPVP